MASNRNFDDMMEANSMAGKKAIPEKLHHMELVHHMESGEMRSHSFQAHEGKEMMAHMAGCPHCSAMTKEPEPDADSAAGAAT
jgi:cell division protein YceG involved in septum cleavage